jgi:asparagine synthase (glutamine-hydrolysing)
VIAADLWQKIRRIPSPLRRLASAAIASLSPTTWDALVSPLANALPPSRRGRVSGDRLHRIATLLRSADEKVLYEQLTSYWAGSGLVVDDGHEVASAPAAPPELPELSPTEHMMAADTFRYLPDDILVKVDRAAMGVSLETRVPYLDHRVFELAWTLPQSLKFRDGQTKWALRQVLYRHLPRALVDRPKMGFGVPVDSWLRGPLREWAEDMLSETRLCQEGYLHAKPIRAKWMEHLSGRRQWQHHLWGVLMFQAWVREQPVARSLAASAAGNELGVPTAYASDQDRL